MQQCSVINGYKPSIIYIIQKARLNDHNPSTIYNKWVIFGYIHCIFYIRKRLQYKQNQYKLVENN